MLRKNVTAEGEGAREGCLLTIGQKAKRKQRGKKEGEEQERSDLSHSTRPHSSVSSDRPISHGSGFNSSTHIEVFQMTS